MIVEAVLAAVLAAGAPPPARVQVVAKEWEYRLSRLAVRSGPVLLELANFGEDEHDLKLRRIGGTRTYSVPKTQPGEQRVLAAKFAPGTFRLWCALPTHAKRGMRAQLVVRR